MGSAVFADCKSLVEVNLPDGLQSMGDLAFSGAKSLAKITLPDSLQKLGEAAFAYTAITELRLPPSITTIPDSLFYGCTNLTELVIPEEITVSENLTSIESRAFAGRPSTKPPIGTTPSPSIAPTASFTCPTPRLERRISIKNQEPFPTRRIGTVPFCLGG